MLGDKIDNFYFKIGNPWESGHFRQSSNDPNFFQLKIDYWQGFRENRIAPAMVEEARKRPFFGVLYECNFPKESIDQGGWVPLLSREEVNNALTESWTPFGESRL